MTVLVTVDGNNYLVPSPGDRNWGQQVTNLLVALSDPEQVLQKDSDTFTLQQELNFGGDFGLKALSLTSQTANTATDGVLRLARTDTLQWRNQANSANLTVGFNSSDQLVINGSTLVGTVTSVAATAPASGFTITGSPITSTGTLLFALNDDLAAVEGLSTTGIAARTAASTWTTRTVTGTSNRISVTNGDGVSGNPTLDISSSYSGQNTITTLGTVTTGTWNGSVVSGVYGGTGVNNGSSTLTIGGNVTFSGAFTFAGTVTGNTAVTFPTSGTLATTTQLPSAANPTASIGLSAVNGSASTFLRSDGAPALSQSITPSWSAKHTFTQSVTATTSTYPISLDAGTPGLHWNEIDQGTDLKRWDMIVVSGGMRLRVLSDDGTTTNNVLSVSRSTSSLSDIQFGNATNNNTFSFLGTGTSTFSGQVSALRFVPTSSTVPTNGLYLIGSNNVGISSNSTYNIDIGTNGLGVKRAPTSSFLLAVAGSAGSGALLLEDTAVADGGRPFGWIRSNGGVLELGNSNRSGTGTTSTVTRLSIAAAGDATFTETVTGKSFIPSSSTAPTNGLYLPASNTVGISTNSTQVMSFGTANAIYQNASDVLWIFKNTGGALDTKNVVYRTGGTAHSISFCDDTVNNLRAILTATRSANAVTDVSLGNSTNNNTYTFPSTGTATFSGAIVCASTVKTISTTVGSLPAAATAGSGSRAFVTDANSTTFAAAAVGGGANKVPVYSDGTGWFIG